MRVLFVNQGRARPGAAMGVVRAHQALELGLAAGESEVHVDFEVVPPFSALERAVTHRVPGLGWNDMRSLRWHLVRSWSARRLIERRLAQSAPDVVHVSTVQVGLVLGRVARRVPCVLAVDVPLIEATKTQQGLPFDAPTPANLRPLLALERSALERAPLCIAWTRTVAERIAAFAPRASLQVLHPGIDLAQFRPAAGAREPGPARILFVGGRWTDKGGPELLEALAPHLGTSIHLDVVSPEPDIPALPGLTVHQANRPGSADTATLFQRADIFCLPTHSDSAPLVLVEAMACGLPIVSTTVGSIPELIGGGCGLVIPPRDVSALRGALLRLSEDPQLRASQGAAGRARAEERYDARRNTAELLETLREVCG